METPPEVGSFLCHSVCGPQVTFRVGSEHNILITLFVCFKQVMHHVKLKINQVLKLQLKLTNISNLGQFTKNYTCKPRAYHDCFNTTQTFAMETDYQTKEPFICVKDGAEWWCSCQFCRLSARRLQFKSWSGSSPVCMFEFSWFIILFLFMNMYSFLFLSHGHARDQQGTLLQLIQPPALPMTLISAEQLDIMDGWSF